MKSKSWIALGILFVAVVVSLCSSKSRAANEEDYADSLPRVMQLALGNGHTCALLSSGKVKCWGNNDDGQLGLGDTNSRGGSPTDMSDALPAVDISSTPVKKIALGLVNTCAILQTGALKCWGNNTNGQLGIGSTVSKGNSSGQMGDNLPLVNLGANVKVKDVAIGFDHICALLEDSRVKCWGDNADGQLGLENLNSRGAQASEMGDALPALNFGTGLSAVMITAGDRFSCALLNNGKIKCWGDNEYGQLGSGDVSSRGGTPNSMGDQLPFVNLGSNVKSIELRGGRQHLCARLENNQIKCWGRNDLGQLGQGDTSSRGSAENQMGDNLKPVDLGSHEVQSYSVGRHHNCVYTKKGEVICWGYNDRGQLGIGDTNYRGDEGDEMGSKLQSLDLENGLTISSIQLSGYHTCASFVTGTVKCWGANESGQLGYGDLDDRGDFSNEMGFNLSFVDLGTR